MSAFYDYPPEVRKICSGRVEKALNDLPGVTAEVNLEAGTAAVQGDASNEALTRAVTEAGYTVTAIE